MKDTLTFPVDHVPDYYLGVRLGRDGTFEEIFNGPGRIAAKTIEARQKTKTNLHSVSLNALRSRQREVAEDQKIPVRKNAEVRPKQE